VAVAVTVGVLAAGATAALLTLPDDGEPAASTTAITVPETVVVPVDPVVVETPLGAMEWTFRSERFPITFGLVEWEGRLLGLTSDGRSLRATDDGRSWVTVGSVPGLHTPIGLAAYDGHLYLVDSRTRMPEGYLIRHPSAWRSPDLRTWEPVPVEQQIPADYLGEIEVVGSDTGVIVIAAQEHAGSSTRPPALLWFLTDTGFASLGQLPATPFDSYGLGSQEVWAVDGGFATSDGASILFSENGASWTEASNAGGEDRGIILVGRGTGGYLAIAEYGRTVLASDDGLTWQKVGTPVGYGGEPTVGFSNDLVPIGDGWIAFAFYSPRNHTAMISADGIDWTGVTPIPGIALYHPIAVGPDLVVAEWWSMDPASWESGTVEIRLLDD
jgi:hypothetical protein